MGNKVRGIVALLLIVSVFAATPSFAKQGAEDTGLPYWRTPQNRPVLLKPIVIADSEGDAALVNGSGELATNAQFSGTVKGTSLLKDSEGDTKNVGITDQAYLYSSVSPGNSHTFDLDSKCGSSGVADYCTGFSMSATGTDFRYELNNSADTNSMPVAQLQYISKDNGKFREITVFNPYTNTSSVDVRVEVLD